MILRVPLLPRWLRWAGVVAVAGVIFYFSVLTPPPPSPVIPAPFEIIPLDMWRHFLAYVAFGGALAYATADWRMRQRVLVFLVVGTTIVYGVGIEAWQAFIPARYFSIGDAWANAFGGLLVLSWFVVRPYLTLVPVIPWIRSYLPGS